MALNRQDCVELAREIEGLLREYDPASAEIVSRATERYDDPSRYVVELLQTIGRVYSERSGGMHGSVLDRINHFVRLQDGSPIRGISVTLSPGERERYEIDEVNLAELQDRSDFLVELHNVTNEIKREAGLRENEQ